MNFIERQSRRPQSFLRCHQLHLLIIDKQDPLFILFKAFLCEIRVILDLIINCRFHLFRVKMCLSFWGLRRRFFLLTYGYCVRVMEQSLHALVLKLLRISFNNIWLSHFLWLFLQIDMRESNIHLLDSPRRKHRTRVFKPIWKDVSSCYKAIMLLSKAVCWLLSLFKIVEIDLRLLVESGLTVILERRDQKWGRKPKGV